MPDNSFDPASGDRLLSVAQMYEADKQTMAAGTAGVDLMERAGSAVADAIQARFGARRTVILCGPGNNGGDGFVVARLLQDAGWPIAVALLGDVGTLTGDAAHMAGRWKGEVVAARPEVLSGAELVVDALFGAGLSRPLDGIAAELVRAIEASGVATVAVDIPSGIDGDSGAVCGAAAAALLTVTFCRAKPGHLLFPGRGLVGELVVADIGIPDRVVGGLRPAQWRNAPRLWRQDYPWPVATDHKHSRGHAVVVGGDMASTGAARLAARGALRAGAGLVTVASSQSALATYAAHLTAIMLRQVDDAPSFSDMLADRRITTVLLGPGAGVGERTRSFALAALGAGKACVLDADALTSFADQPQELFSRLGETCALTPHEGEFARLFETTGNKLGRTREAARRSGAVVLLKGADTVIAAPDGRAVINDNAPSDLATAGSGDVLAGFITGLLAQGVPAFTAAAMAAWLHGAVGKACGHGLIAEDLPEILPMVLRQLDEATA